MAKVKLTKDQKAEIAAGALLDQIDPKLEPDVLTDKAKTKVVGCRIPACKRPCIVTYFASAAKTACHEHRDRHAPITVVHDLKSDLEPHVLTDKEDTKTVPCRHCGRPCVVTLFASAPKVACKDCRKSAPRPRKTTEYKPGDDGRMIAETKTQIMSERDMAWTEWTIGQPWHFDRIYDGDEQERNEAAKQAKLTAGREIGANKRSLLTTRDKLNMLPERSNAEAALERADKDKKESKQKVLDEVTALEDEIDALESRNVELAETVRLNDEESARIVRIAYIRGALASGFWIEERDSQRYLVGRERADVPIPRDFLASSDYHIAEKTVPALV